MTTAAKPEIVRSTVPTVINVAVGDSISHPPEKNIFSVVAPASLESSAQLKVAQQNGAKKIAIVAQHDAWGTPRYAPLMAAFKKANLEPVIDEKIAEDANDATPQVLRLKSAGADAVIMLARPKAAAVLLRDAIKIGYKPDWWSDNPRSVISTHSRSRWASPVRSTISLRSRTSSTNRRIRKWASGVNA